MDERPRKNEDEYFTRQDAELVKELRAKLDQQRATAERKSHYMKCPKCGGDLVEREQDSVKIDVCPECKGMWLDAGEIDILRTASRRGGTFVEDLFGMFQLNAR
jgi:uncharacterized protein